MEHEIKHIQIRVDPQTYKQLRIFNALAIWPWVYPFWIRRFCMYAPLRFMS